MRSSALVAALALAACSGGLDGPSLAAPPLATLHGHVDVAALPEHGPLVAALLWLNPTEPDAFCLAHAADPELAGACPDPYWVRASRVSESAPVRADGTFDIAIVSLPGEGTFIGGVEGQLGVGTVVVVSDDDGDGLAEPFEVLTREGNAPPVDRVLAASFVSSRLPADRVVLRAGSPAPAPTFYPAPACAEPPRGFSLQRAPPWGVAGTCTTTDLARTLEAAPLTEDQRPAISCPDRGSSTSPVTDFSPDEQATQVCLDHETLVVVEPGSLCPRVSVLRLAGCFGPGSARLGDPTCPGPPDFDRRLNPPGWWPC